MSTQISVYQVDSASIYLMWPVDNTGTVSTWNLYGSSTYNGTYTLIETNIPNYANSVVAPGSVFVSLTRAALSIADDQPFFFAITSVSPQGAESSLDTTQFKAVDALESVIRERMMDNINPVYKNVTVSVASGANGQFVDLERILGREASYLRISTDQDVLVALNSSTNDQILVRSSTSPFILAKSDLGVKSAYLTFVSNTASVTFFVSGD